MNRSFKPQIDILEDRMVMDAAGMHMLYQDVFVPAVAASAAAVTGRITAVAVDPQSAEPARPLPVLLVIANRDFYLVEQKPTAELGWPIVPAVQKVREVAARSAWDDVWVDGKIITAENFN